MIRLIYENFFMDIHEANILITGGAGAFGRSFAFDIAS
jgi:FlaA1/EpsC-like NDP-sugar epimerase